MKDLRFFTHDPNTIQDPVEFNEIITWDSLVSGNPWPFYLRPIDTLN